jgi:hypothetical protein
MQDSAPSGERTGVDYNPQAKSTCRGRGERGRALGLGSVIFEAKTPFQPVWSAHEGSYMFAAGRAHLGFKEK